MIIQGTSRIHIQTADFSGARVIVTEALLGVINIQRSQSRQLSKFSIKERLYQLSHWRTASSV